MVTVTMLCGFAGCGKKETSSSVPLSSSSVMQSIPTDTSTIISDNIGSSGAQSVQNNGQSDFDFDEAVKNMTLFGQKISLPCYWSDFGEVFSHDEMYISSDDDLMCTLRYKGKIIGDVFFGNCAETEDTSEAESHPIVCIVIGFTDYSYFYDEYDLNLFESLGYYTGQLEFVLGDVMMSSTEDDIIAVLGEPSKITEGGSRWRYLDYKYDNGYFHFVFDVNKEPCGIMELYIKVY